MFNEIGILRENEQNQLELFDIEMIEDSAFKMHKIEDFALVNGFVCVILDFKTPKEIDLSNVALTFELVPENFEKSNEYTNILLRENISYNKSEINDFILQNNITIEGGKVNDITLAIINFVYGIQTGFVNLDIADIRECSNIFSEFFVKVGTGEAIDNLEFTNAKLLILDYTWTDESIFSESIFLDECLNVHGISDTKRFLCAFNIKSVNKKECVFSIVSEK